MKKNIEGLWKRKNLEPLLKIIVGNILMGFAYAKWMKPDAIINGGVTSLSMIINKATTLPILYLTNGITVILLGVSWYFLGRQNFFRSILSSICYNAFFSWFYLWNINLQINLPVDFVLATIFIAIGYYCCITADASTVGMDVVALIAHKKNPKVNVAKTIRWINFIVLAFGFLVYGLKSVVIGVLFSFANSYVLNKFLTMDRKWSKPEKIPQKH